jgi:hypothetical protein
MLSTANYNEEWKKDTATSTGRRLELSFPPAENPSELFRILRKILYES